MTPVQSVVEFLGLGHFGRHSAGNRVARRRRAVQAGLATQIEASEQRCLLSNVTYMPSEIPPMPQGGPQGGPPGDKVALTNLPVLNSRPGAPVSVILKVDGYTDDHPNWVSFRNRGTGPIVTRAFDLDGDATTFNAEELRQIEEIWYRVSEDFAPFNINVTTIAPPTLNDFEHVMVIIGGNNDWAPAAGGWGQINGFSTGGANTNYVFSELFFNPHQIASASSHESGHTFGLLHQSVYDANGNKTAEYNPGDANSAPLMGVGYGTTRDTWWNGTSSASSTSIQDDLAQLTRPANQTVQFRADDYGNTIATAFQVPISGPAISIGGVLEQNGDVDVFRIEANTGPASFSVTGLDLAQVYGLAGLTPGTNTDLIIRLYDSNGVLIAEDDPANSLSASISTSLSIGTYYVAVTHVAQFGAIGQYTLSGTIVPVPSIPTMLAPTGTIAIPVPTFEWTVGANAASYQLEVDSLTAPRTGYYTASVTSTTHVAVRQFEQGDYRARVRTVASDGLTSGWSNYVSFTIDIPAPGTPVITRPQGDIGDSFPLFEWSAAANAAAYSLWVTNVSTGTRVIYRTSQPDTTYTHTLPLPDGMYRAWVRAFNSIGEQSPWSNPVSFTIDAPIPATPRLTAPAVVTPSTNPRFIWTAVDGVSYYDLWVNNNSTGRSQVIRQSALSRTQTFYDPPFMTQGNYTAWIRAINGNGEASPWSTAYQFTVDIPAPAKPQMTGPRGANNSLIVDTINPTFTWTTAARAVKYDLWVNNITTGQAQIIRKQDLTATTYTSLANLPQGDYRAFVRGINAGGDVGEWSDTFTFTIDEPVPVTPLIVKPTSNAAGSVENANPTFEWTMTTDAPLYELKVDDQTLGGTSVIRVNGLTEKKYTVPTNKRFAEHIYVAQVRAYNASGDASDWSPIFRFRIDVPDPATPTLLTPGDTTNDRTPTFSWTYSSTAFRYEILVRDLLRNENIVLNVTSFSVSADKTTASYVLPDNQALRAGTYRFWIRAFNSLGQSSNWSASKSFVIADAGLGARENSEQLTAVRDVASMLTAFEQVDPAAGRAVAAAPARNEAGDSTSRDAEDAAAQVASEQQRVVPVEWLDAALADFADPAVALNEA